MDTLTQLIERYRTSPKVKQIADILQKTDAPTRLQLNGLMGAQESFVLTGAYLNAPQPYLIVAIDKDEAAYLQNDLQSLLTTKTVHYLPDSFKRPTYFEEINANNVLQRTEVIDKLAQSTAQGEVIVTYPEALFEKVVAPQYLDEKRISITVGENFDVDFVAELLVDFGFLRVDFVYSPGQFSIRGGIVDVYSYGNEYPYRIELFDIEVESIRTFDPTTQLSQQKIRSVNIVPNINTRFERNQKTSIFSILPENTVIFCHDFENIIDRLQICFDKAEAFGEKLRYETDEEIKEIFRDRAFIRPTEVIEDVKALHIVLLRGGKTAHANVKISEKIDFNAKPQPSFNKNFNLLIHNLHENEASKLKNYLFTDNEKQMNRLFSIFHDLGSKTKVEPILKAIREGFIDLELKVACYTDHQIFERFHRARTRQGFSREQSLNLRMLKELQAGDFVTHIDHGVGKFSGLEKININGQIQEAVRLVYSNNDLLYVSINSLHKIARFVGKDGTPPKLNRIGSDAWQNLKKATKKKVKDIAAELIKLYAARKAAGGFAFPPDNYLQNELEASFMYEDTPDQATATADVKADMERSYPMDRLVCGDVGFGKTEVALRAAFKAVTSGKQVAILVPTTILAMQHYKTFSERLGVFGATVDYINRFRTTKEKKEVMENTKIGKVDVLIGTHAILNKDMEFKDLGLLVIDEEQKFGVAAKERLRKFKVNVDTLTLTATPIPRTLQFSLMAARDLSIIRTPPPNRQPIQTEVCVFNDELIKEAIYKETNRGGQVFFVHNRVSSLPDMVTLLRGLCPDIDITMAHGQMPPDELEQTLVAFIERKYDVLVCTNIIETGLDIANANTMIINHADKFGLSDLHQLRGRVGRSNKKAYCYLFSPPLSVLTPEARLRLRTLEEFTDLGDGFNIAMRDMDIRGAGNLLGGEQSGFIADVGYETYQKILDEAIMELKQSDFKELFKEELEKKNTYVTDVSIDTDIEMHIPDEYVSNTQERLNLYTQLDEIENEAGIEAFAAMLKDRFGKIPLQVEELFDGLRLRWAAKELSFERIVLKNNKLQGFFVGNPQSPFYESAQFQKIMKYVLSEGKTKQMSFKQSPKHFIFIRENVKTLNGARNIVEILRGVALNQKQK
ncbi:MAG: transcription-repair coupling factor [Saprospiraceae bacterium]|nr:transcription-repair coupling factor [Saprospiraceae bacterium]